MPAPAHLVDSLGRCGVSFVVIAFYVLVAIATIVGLVGPATLVTWNVVAPQGVLFERCNGDMATCNITHKISISGLATYNQLVAVMAKVHVPTTATDNECQAASAQPLTEYVGYDQTYTLLAVGVDGSDKRTTLSDRSHHDYFEFDVGSSSSPTFLMAYYPQCVTLGAPPCARALPSLLPFPLFAFPPRLLPVCILFVRVAGSFTRRMN